jgi:hypothetical protein
MLSDMPLPRYKASRNPNNLYRQQQKTRSSATAKIILFVAATTLYTAFLYSRGALLMASVIMANSSFPAAHLE